jgi:hypothetical protein
MQSENDWQCLNIKVHERVEAFPIEPHHCREGAEVKRSTQSRENAKGQGVKGV